MVGLQIPFGNAAIFTHLTLLIHEHGFIQLSTVFFSFSVQCFRALVVGIVHLFDWVLFLFSFF